MSAIKRKRKNETTQPAAEAKVSAGRHETRCTICSHPEREQIEQEFINWASPAKIVEQHQKPRRVTRDAIYRHAHALGLMQKRRCNIRAALERIIEKAGDVEVNAAAVVAAVSAFARINSRGEWVERTETLNLTELFQRMSPAELDIYAKTGALPAWLETATGATRGNSQEVPGEQ